LTEQALTEVAIKRDVIGIVMVLVVVGGFNV
jgi:hypothetical protein